MPLHTIPLCSFNYVGDTLSSATFKYDVREGITKNKTKLFYKKHIREIDKTDVKNYYTSTIKISKNDSKNIIVSDDNEVNKNLEISLDKTNKPISKPTVKELNSIEKEVIKENLLALNSSDINIDKLKNKSLLRVRNIELSKADEKQLNREINYKLDNSNKIIDLNNVGTIKNININSNVNVEVVRQHKLDKNESGYLYRDKEKGLDITLNNKYVDINVVRDIDIKNNILYVNRVTKKGTDILTSIYLDRENSREIVKIINSKLAYKTNNFKLDKYNYVNVEKDNIKGIMKFIDSKLFYINTLKRLSKANNTLGLNKDTIYRNSKYNSICLDKDIVKNVIKYNCVGLDKDKIIKIFKNKSNSLEDMRFRNIFKDDLLGLNKDELQIDNRIEIKELNKEILINKDNELKGLNKFKTGIYIPYTTTDLEVIKRWWVLGATSPHDQKILPIDYNYLKKPLSINRRDREYGWLIDQDKHPISFMSYLEDLQGIDLGYGLEEMALSIEIMLDMVNIVGMIVQHSASQFANCSGQEAMEFIMEVLLDWLNLDSTVKEMNLKGSREHYLRCYRWIRWEAEKVWFIADKDHSMDKMMGIKYAGMLFANLLDYMKYHHFDIVPLWENLKYMDIERQFSRVATNGDLMKNLDKLKGKRHYYVETQNFEKKNIFRR